MRKIFRQLLIYIKNSVVPKQAHYNIKGQGQNSGFIDRRKTKKLGDITLDATTMAVIATGEDYEKHFDVDLYLNYIYESADTGMTDMVDFILTNLHTAFSEGSIKGQQLLDVGSGPSIHCVISASSYVDEIYLTDYAQRNIDKLQKWLNGEISLQEKQVQRVCKLENKGQSVEERMNQIRKKVKKIIHFDITDLDSLAGSGIPEQYDIITCCWCLNSAGQTTELYTKCAKNIHSLLKPGGYFFLVDAFNCSLFTLENNGTFPTFNLSDSELHRIYRETGFRILDVKIHKFNHEAVTGEEETLFAMFAQKTV